MTENNGDLRPHTLRESVMMLHKQMGDSFLALNIKLDAMDKEHQQEQELQRAICKDHGTRLESLETSRNLFEGGVKAVGALGGAGAILGFINHYISKGVQVLKSIGLVIFFASTVNAAPYFRLIDIKHPKTSAGAYVAIDDPAQSSAGTSLALITHSPKDGTILPNLPDDWTPLAVGFAANSGKFLFALGPSWNLSPIVRQALYTSVCAVTSADKYLGLKSILAPTSSTSDISISFGPAWLVSPTENWKGYGRLQVGAKWEF